ncbi:hypothetical protein HDV03_003434 [Kappamyces sp. JEL0829]|nr:hypothetical protein HDV03_003434 [Kappamyces sp. JEL0829]
MFGNHQEPGIMPLAVRHIFNHIAQQNSREYLLRVSYMEIYNEIIKDLLKPGNDNLKVHQNPTGEIFVGELTEQMVSSIADVESLLDIGDRNRVIGETNMNEKSSRSHTIFRMTIESRPMQTEGIVQQSLLNLVDLAGSERVALTGAEGIRLKEGGHINKSLLALGTVIAKLSEDRDNYHIPYRDSKLTRILQSSLGGNARTGIVCTITPASQHLDETLSTLRFANRAKNITNRPKIVSEDALLKLYKQEIELLKAQLLESEARRSAESLEAEAPAPAEPEGEARNAPYLASLRQIIDGGWSESDDSPQEIKARQLANGQELAGLVQSLQSELRAATESVSNYKEYLEFACLESESFRKDNEQMRKRPIDDAVAGADKKVKLDSSEADLEIAAATIAGSCMLEALQELLAETSLDVQNTALDTLQTKHDRQLQVCLELEASNSSLLREIDSLQILKSQLAENTQELLAVNEGLSATAMDLSERNAKLVAELSDTRQDMEDTREQLGEKIHELATELEASSTKYDALQSQLQSQEQQFKDAESQWQTRQEDHLHLNTEIQRLEEAKLATETELQALQAQQAELQSAYGALEQTLLDSKEASARDKDSLLQAIEEKELLIRELRHDLAQIGLIQANLASTSDLLAESQNAVARLTAQLTSLQSELQSRDDQLQRLSEAAHVETASVNKTLLELQLSNDELSQLNETLTQSEAALRLQVSDRDKLIASSTADLCTIQAAVQTLVPKMKALYQRLVAMESRLPYAAIEQKRAMVLQLSRMQSELSSSVESKLVLEKQIEFWKGQHETTQKASETAQQLAEQLASQLHSLEEDLQTRVLSGQQLESQLQESNQAIASLEHAKAALAQELEEIKSGSIQEKQALAEENERLVGELQEEIKCLQSQCEVLQTKLKIQIEAAQDQAPVADHSQSVIRDLQEQIVELKKKLTAEIGDIENRHAHSRVEENTQVKKPFGNPDKTIKPAARRSNRLKSTKAEETCNQQ